MYNFMLGQIMLCIIDVSGIDAYGKLAPTKHVSTHLVRGVIVTVTDEFYHYSVDFEKSFRQMGVPMSENTWVKQMTERNNCHGDSKNLKLDHVWGQ